MKIIALLAVCLLSANLAFAKGGLSLQGTISDVAITDDAISFTFTGMVSLYINTTLSPTGERQTPRWAVTKMPISVRRWASEPPYDKMKPADDSYAVTFQNAVFRAKQAKSDTDLKIELDGPPTILSLDREGGLAKVEAQRVFIFPPP